jgi:hypothetical protein
MFTTDRFRVWLFAGALAGGLTAASLCAQEPPLPQPPLQPTPPKEFKAPKPKLALPDLIPVSQQPDSPGTPTKPLPPRPIVAKPEAGQIAPKPPAAPTPGVTLAPSATTDTRLTGKILRVEKDHIVVETTDHKAIVLHVDPQTRFLRRDVAAKVTDLAPGTAITAIYTPRGERYWVTMVDIVPPELPTPANPPGPVVVPVPVKPPVVVVPAAPQVTIVLPATAYETEIVRVEAPDQIVVRNAAGVEFPVYVTTATRYQVRDARATYADLRPGMRIRIDDEVRADRHFARQIVGVRR